MPDTSALTLARAVLESRESRPKTDSNTVFLDYRDWEYVKELARQVLKEEAPMPTPETRDAALLPCPRCGSPVSAHAGAFGDWWDIQCTAENCRLHLPDAGETEAQAIAAWNRRTPDTPARPEGETAASPWSMLGDSAAEQSAYDRVYAVIGDCDAIQLDRYLAEYRAACRAALLSGAPTVWVATFDRGDSWLCTASIPAEADGIGEWLPLVEGPLTQPGTVRRYALVPIEEEGRDG